MLDMVGKAKVCDNEIAVCLYCIVLSSSLQVLQLDIPVRHLFGVYIRDTGVKLGEAMGEAGQGEGLSYYGGRRCIIPMLMTVLIPNGHVMPMQQY